MDTVHFCQQWMTACVSCSFKANKQQQKNNLKSHSCKDDPLLLLLKHTTCCLTVLTFSVRSPSMFSKYWCMSVDATFSIWKTQFYTFALSALPYQIAPLLLSVSRQQNTMEHGWGGSVSTAVLPTSASDLMCQQNKVRDVMFGADLIDLE